MKKMWIVFSVNNVKVDKIDGDIDVHRFTAYKGMVAVKHGVNVDDVKTEFSEDKMTPKKHIVSPLVSSMVKDKLRRLEKFS